MQAIKKIYWNKIKNPYFFWLGWGAFWVLSFLILQAKGSALSLDSVGPITPSSPLSVDAQFEQQVRQQYANNPRQGERLLGELRNELRSINNRWRGRSPAEVLTLRDLEDSLQLQNLSLEQIEQLSGQDVGNLSLSELPYFNQRNLRELLSNVPSLRNQSVGNVPYFQDLLSASGYDPNQVSGESMGRLLQRNPNLGNIRLNTGNLSDQYALAQIPQLNQTPLRNLSGWQNWTVASVPRLASVALERLGLGAVATIDFVLSEVEGPSRDTISGGNMVGFNVPCSSNCAHIEVGENPVVAGKQWISGEFQEIPGGHGFLGAMFGGKEPTGRHWFTNKFKVVLTGIDESTDTAEFSLYFRICKQWLGCTPYGIGPFPFFTTRVGQKILLGR
jgi:hypothetical protein